MINPQDCFWVAYCVPDSMITTHLVAWMWRLGVLDNVLFFNNMERHVDCTYNAGIKEALKQDRFEHLVFCDHDIRPTDKTMEFWNSEADIVGCRYPTGNTHSWDNPHTVHGALWRSTKSVLRAIEPPWFRWIVNEDASKTIQCLCHYFCSKARDAGFTIEQGGIMYHKPRRYV